MQNQSDLLDRFQRERGLTSDYQAAKALGWATSTVSSYRTGRRAMDIQQALEFAEKSGIRLEDVVRAAVADRERLRTKKGKQLGLPLRAA